MIKKKNYNPYYCYVPEQSVVELSLGCTEPDGLSDYREIIQFVFEKRKRSASDPPTDPDLNYMILINLTPYALDILNVPQIKQVLNWCKRHTNCSIGIKGEIITHFATNKEDFTPILFCKYLDSLDFSRVIYKGGK